MTCRTIPLLCLLVLGLTVSADAWGSPHRGGALSGCEGAATEVTDLNAALLAASEAGCSALVANYLRKGASPDARGRNGDTPLIRAVTKNRPETVAVLLEAGADPDRANDLGLTPLAAAVYRGAQDLVTLLLQAGARSGWSYEKCEEPQSPIVFAARKGYSGIVRQLLESGVDVNTRYSQGMTALMFAAGHGREVPESVGAETASLLIERGADMERTNQLGRNALMIAAKRGNLEILTLLLDRGADPLHVDSEGNSAFELTENKQVLEELGRAVRANEPHFDN